MTDREKEVEEYLKKKQQKEKFKEDLVNITKGLITIITPIVAIICYILMHIYRMRNPHLTETELMIYASSHYWWVLILFIICAIIRIKE